MPPAPTLLFHLTALHETVDKHKIKHTFAPSKEGHVSRNWRDSLAELTPQLFRSREGRGGPRPRL